MGKNDPRILAIVTRELVAVEACYHKSCYRDYTRNIQEAVSSDTNEDDNCFQYTNAESVYLHQYRFATKPEGC